MQEHLFSSFVCGNSETGLLLEQVFILEGSAVQIAQFPAVRKGLVMCYFCAQPHRHSLGVPAC